MDQLSLGVMARSLKENEHRLPLHPEHLDRIPEDLRGRSSSSTATASGTACPTTSSSGSSAASAAASSSWRECDVILRPSRCSATSRRCGTGQVLWGWPHCVQDASSPRSPSTAADADRVRGDEPLEQRRLVQPPRLPQEQRARRLLLGAARPADRRDRPATTAGGCARSSSASARPPRSGHALNALGVARVDVLTHRRRRPWPRPIHSARIVHFDTDDADGAASHAVTRDGRCRSGASSPSTTSSSTACSRTPTRPLTFLTDDDLAGWRRAAVRRRLVRRGHGLQLGAAPTFADPTFVVGDHVLYYAVDHSPSLPLGLGDLGDQRGPAAVLRDRHGRPRRVGREPDDPAGHRDPRRRDPEPRDPVVPGSLRRSTRTLPLATWPGLHATREGRGGVLTFLAGQPILLLALLLLSAQCWGTSGWGRWRSARPRCSSPRSRCRPSVSPRVNLQIPENVGTLGLVLFTYTIGVVSGPSFFASLRRGWPVMLRSWPRSPSSRSPPCWSGRPSGSRRRSWPEPSPAR